MTTEQSVDLTPGVVWTEAQLDIVRDLTTRLVKAEAAAHRVLAKLRAVEELADQLQEDDAAWPIAGTYAEAFRRALDAS